MSRLACSAALVALAFVASSATGNVAASNYSVRQKVAQVDAVVTGKVTEIEAEEIDVLPHQGAKDKVKMKVAVVKVADGLLGAKNVTHVKVVFAPGPSNPVRPGRWTTPVADGQDGVFFLTKHPSAASYFYINPGFDPIPSKAENYKGELDKVKASAAAIGDPMKALKADKADDRLAAAATLVLRYRRLLSVPAKEEAIPAEETKAILKILADADWTLAEKPGARTDYSEQPTLLASMIGLQPGLNGFPEVTTKPGESRGTKYQEVFKAWLTKSGDKFEIKRIVPKEK